MFRHALDSVVLRSTFYVRRSTFVVRRSTFGVRRSTFYVRRSTFGVRRSAFWLDVLVLRSEQTGDVRRCVPSGDRLLLAAAEVPDAGLAARYLILPENGHHSRAARRGVFQRLVELTGSVGEDV